MLFRSMAASNGEIRLLRYRDDAGKKVYTRTACFLVFLAIRKCWPEGTAKISCTMGNSVYISVRDCKDFSIDRLKEQMDRFIRENFPLIRRRVPLQEAIRQYEMFSMYHSPSSHVSIACSREVIELLLASVLARFNTMVSPE